ncbi:hypothetical protein BH11MYX3_BH11MYX3_18290 [soil metagenome]
MRWPILVLPLIALGCGDDDRVHHLADAPIPPAARGLYVTQEGGSIAVFALDATGDAAPIRSISGPATGLNLPIGIDVEPVTGFLYVANRRAGTVTVYTPEAIGDVAPVKTLTATGMGSPEGVAFTTAGDLYVSTCPGCGGGNGGQTGVFRFSAGSTTSDATLGGAANANTGFTNPGSIAIDPDTGELVIGNSFMGNISTFSAGVSGDVAPARAFSPGSLNLQSIAVAAGTVFVAAPGSGSVLKMFPTSATGTPAPTMIQNGGALSVTYPGGVFVDGGGSSPVLYIVDYMGNAVHIVHTTGVAPDLSVATVDTIRGAATTLSGPLWVRLVR